MEAFPIWTSSTLQTLDDVDAYYDACIGPGCHRVTPVDRQRATPYSYCHHIETDLLRLRIEDRRRTMTTEWQRDREQITCLIPIRGDADGACIVDGYRLAPDRGLWIAGSGTTECFCSGDRLILAFFEYPIDIILTTTLDEDWLEGCIPFRISQSLQEEVARLLPKDRPPASHVDALGHALLECARDNGRPGEPPQTTAFNVAKAAYRVLREEPDLAPDIDALAERVDSSRRTLEYGIRRHLGTSPGRLAKALRLRRVLDHLQREPNETKTIAAIAREHGFHHPGHFARDYCDLFGELPHETLRRQQQAGKRPFSYLMDQGHKPTPPSSS